MARRTTSGNTVTDTATGLMWVKDVSKIIPNSTGSLGTHLGAWSASMGSVGDRQVVGVSLEAQCGSSVTSGFVYKWVDMEYGDFLWYRAKQTYSIIAYRPGIDTGWNTYWAEVPLFEQQEGITYTAGNYRVSMSNYQVYSCISGYTTGSGPDDPSVDTTHWSVCGAASAWTNGTTYYPNNMVDVWGTIYVCILTHTANYHLPGVDTNYWEASVENWVCISAHTAAADKAPGHATYWLPIDLDLFYNPHTNPGTGGKTLSQWLAAINALNYEGHSDWRLPNILELLTTIDFETNAVATAYVAPNKDYGDNYITSTFCKDNDNYDSRYVIAVVPNNTYGKGVTLLRKPFTSANTAYEWFFVRPVRGGLQA